MKNNTLEVSFGRYLLIIAMLFTVHVSQCWADFDQAVVQPDGKILVSGSFAMVEGHESINVARLNPNGTVDLTFKVDVPGVATTVALTKDNRIVTFVALSNPVKDAPPLGRVAFLDTNGMLQAFCGPTFRVSTPLMYGPRLYSTPDDKLMLMSQFYYPEVSYYRGIARFEMDGTLDESFKSNDSFAFADNIHFRPDGSMLVQNMSDISILSPTGVTLRTYSEGSLNSSASLTNGNFLLSYSFAGRDTQTNVVLRYFADGSRDESYELRTKSPVKLFSLRNGHVVVWYPWNYGEKKLLDSHGRFLRDLAFPPELVLSEVLLEQEDGKLLVSGLLYGPQFRNQDLRMARLNPDFTLDKSFNHFSDKELNGVWLEVRQTDSQYQLELHWRKFRTAAIYQSTDLKTWSFHSIKGLTGSSPIFIPIEPGGNQLFFKVVGE